MQTFCFNVNKRYIIYNQMDRPVECYMHICVILSTQQVLGIGALLVFMVPFGCALFPQTCEVRTADLSKSDPEAFQEAVKKYGTSDAVPQKLYFNKGL